ncbi:3851_t:CDS:2 [Cetraspora pellucida]|uniref:3851_t:CDS:1 n=1 Tax=Cetraspora pellucida TaxID=1433469 RepID=A0A9N9EJV8_9GLOM|nr:3851_t:CDS:2 [Cetraspora pellucida]
MTTSSSITYSYLSQKIIDSEAPSEEILDSLSAQQKIEVLKLCYDSQRKLLNKLLKEKRIEQAIIEIPTIEPSKRDKHYNVEETAETNDEEETETNNKEEAENNNNKETKNHRNNLHQIFKGTLKSNPSTKELNNKISS